MTLSTRGRMRPSACAAVLATFAVAFALAACGARDNAQANKSAAATKSAPSTGGQPRGQPAAPPLPVTVMTVQPQSVPIVLEAVGQTEGSKAVEVRARVSGILLRQLYAEGDAVRANQDLFQIDPATYEIALAQARAAALQDQARIEQYQRDVERLRPLAQQRAVSQKEYDDATSQLQLARAAAAQSAARVREAELNLSYTRVKAPVGGISGRAEHSVGSLITTDANGSLLTTIDQLNPIWVRFSLAQSDIQQLPGGRLLEPGRNTGVTVVLADGREYPAKGKLNFAATAIDPKLGTQQLRAELDNRNAQLIPGQFVRVRLAAGTRDNVFLLPQPAIVQTEKTYLAFVVDAEGKVMSKPVSTGEWFGSAWIVTKGLDAGDRVIVDNLAKLRPGIDVAIQSETPALTALTAMQRTAQTGGAPVGAPAASGGPVTSTGSGAAEGATPAGAAGVQAEPSARSAAERENMSPKGAMAGGNVSGSTAPSR